MTDKEKAAFSRGFELARRSCFIEEFVFVSIERSVNNCNGSSEYVRIDERAWLKLIRQAHKALSKLEAQS